MGQPSPHSRPFARLTESDRPAIACHLRRTLVRVAGRRFLPQANSDDRKETCETSRSDPSTGNCPAITSAGPVYQDLQTARGPEKVRAGKTQTRSAWRYDLLRE